MRNPLLLLPRSTDIVTLALEAGVLPLRAGLVGTLRAGGLHAQAGREHELADGGAETAQEGVEGLFCWGVVVSIALTI